MVIMNVNQEKIYLSINLKLINMIKKNITKKQHYVPKLHLKHFSLSSGKKNYHIYSFDKKSEIQGKMNINKAAMENYFYGKDAIGQTIEYSLSLLENNINKHIYRELISSEDPMVFEIINYKFLFAQFVAIQVIRTKNYLEDLRVYSKRLKEVILEGNPEFDDNELCHEVNQMDSENAIRKLHLSSFKENKVKELASIFTNQKWVLLVNNTPIPFWTSDNPVARFNPFDLSPHPNMGFLSRGIQTYFPLSTKLCLCILDPEIYKTYNKMEKIDPMFLELHKMQVDKINIYCIMDVIFINSLQVKECYRQVFSKTKDFDLAEEMVQSNPRIKDIENKSDIKVQKNWRGPGRDLIISTNKGHK